MNKFYSFIRGVFWLPFKILYPTKVLNKQNVPADGRLVSVTNHISWKDIPVLAINVPGYRRFIAKKEIGKNKLVHKLAEMIGVIFIDRQKADMHAIRESVNTLKAGDGIAIFPEGTRNKSQDGGLQEIKNGVTLLAIKDNAPIVPMMIYGKERVFRKNYIYIGEPFDLDEFRGVLLDGETLAKAGEKVAMKMTAAREDMLEFVAQKKWIEQKKELKSRRKALRKANSDARKSYSRYLKERRRIGRA